MAYFGLQTYDVTVVTDILRRSKRNVAPAYVQKYHTGTYSL